MRSRILKRPMFRMGGSTDNVGIMRWYASRYDQIQKVHKKEMY